MSFILVKNLLKNKNDVIYKETASTGLEKIMSEKPSLVLLDVMLPDGSGFDLLKKIRTKYDQFSLPVIMFTSKQENDDVVFGFKEGANDYLVKPINAVIALARIETQLRLEVQHHTLVHKGEQEVAEALVSTYNHELNNPLSIIAGNLQRLKQKVGPTDEMLKLEENLVRMGKMIKTIQKSVNQGVEKKEFAAGSYMIKKTGTS
jgi:DNA-binding response OmpR family regulator